MMSAANHGFSQDHAALLDSLATTPDLLLIQDLDGVCMGLVHDPLTRTLERAYLDAAARLGDAFAVLTNGEHIGARGVNAIVDRVFGAPGHAAAHGAYLPGPAACSCRTASARSAIRASATRNWPSCRACPRA
jgi:glucosylglycerol 3-phosphatase